MADTKELLKKYGNIIKEEVNVKEIDLLPEDIKVTKVFKPVGRALSAKFGKATGSIIKFSKMGNVEELGNRELKVFGDGKEWILTEEECELVFEGLDNDTMAAQESTVIKLDLTITDELRREGVAREISRFLNQMRKNINYNVDDRVNMYFESDSKELTAIIKEFEEFFKTEALLTSVNEGIVDGDGKDEFEAENGKAVVVLKK